MAGFDPPAVWIRRAGETSGAPGGPGATGHAGAERDHAEALLREVVGGPAARDAAGRPFLPGGGPHVSVSHHGGRIAVAASTAGPVGVDIEGVRDVPAQAIAERWFDAAEAQWLAGLPPARLVVAFLRLWTLKEAVGKALGVGLAGGGMRRPVGPLQGTGAAAEEDRGAAGAVLAPLAAVPGMCGAAFVHGDLVVAVACRAASVAGSTVRLHA